MLKYGIVLSGAKLKNWQLRSIERLHQSKLGELHCVINDVGAPTAAAEASSLYRGVPSEAYAPSDALSRLMPPDSQYDIALSGSVLPTFATERFGVDFFLSFTSAQSTMALADAAPYGIWYFARSDLKRFSSAAPGFWEVCRDDDVTAAYLLQARSDGTAGVPLKYGYLPTQRQSFEQNVEALVDAIVAWPQHVCWDILHDAAGYFGDAPMPEPALHCGDPSPLDIGRMRLRERQRRAATKVRNSFYTLEWTIARVKESPADFIGTERNAQVEYLYPRNKRAYLADPCVVMRDAKAFLFCEEYRHGTNVGTLAVSSISDDGASVPQAAIEETHHLSYPYVFEHAGETYCIPESGGIRKVCLYRCVEFPHKWQYVHTLIDGFEAADSTVVHYGDRWWLFCTSSEAVPKGNYSHLYIWHADDLFGTWTQHVRNPVKIDARSSRPAGAFFVHDGALYRPAQDCARSYGGAVHINRIDTLTETEFQETVVGTLRPPRRRYSRGLHTLSGNEGFCAVDVERYVFSLANARYTCTQAIRSALLRMGISEDTVAWISRRVKSPQAAEMAETAAGEQVAQ